MNSYSIEIEKSALKALKKMDENSRTRIKKAISLLSEELRPDGVKKLTDSDGLYRVRVGSCRIIYQIRDRKLIVLVVKVGDRKEIYK